MPPSFSHCSLEREDKGKLCKYCGDGLLGYRDDEVRVSRVGGEGNCTSSMASEVWIRAV